MQLNYLIRELIDSVQENDKKRFNCPKCGGLNSFNISRIGSEVKYHCYRDVCKLSGSIRTLASLNALKSRLNASRKREEEFSVPAHWIRGISSKNMVRMLITTNSMFPYQQGYFNVAYDPEMNRFVYLILNESGKVVGAVGRAMGKGHKVHNYAQSVPNPFTCGKGDTLVLVEDCASACAVSRDCRFTGMALLGTSLREEYIPYIVRYNKVIIALDNDAKRTALKIKNSLSYYHPNVSVWLLKQDIKDMDDGRFKDFVVGKGI